MIFCAQSNIYAMKKGTSKNIEKVRNIENNLLKQSPPRTIPQQKTNNGFVVVSPPDYIALTNLSSRSLTNSPNSRR